MSVNGKRWCIGFNEEAASGHNSLLFVELWEPTISDCCSANTYSACENNLYLVVCETRWSDFVTSVNVKRATSEKFHDAAAAQARQSTFFHIKLTGATEAFTNVPPLSYPKAGYLEDLRPTVFRVAPHRASARRITTVTNCLLAHSFLPRRLPPVSAFNIAACRRASGSDRSSVSVLDSLKSILDSHLEQKAKSKETPALPSPFRTYGQERPFEEQSRGAEGLGLDKVYESPKLAYSYNSRNTRHHIIYPDKPWSNPEHDLRGTEVTVNTARNGAYTTILGKDYLSPRMKSFIQIMNTPTADKGGTTLMLHFDDKRYLFGSIGEGTQRMMNEMGSRMLKMHEIFITGRSEWANTGGLIGMMLTVADATMNSTTTRKDRWGVQEEKKTLTLFGPPNLNYTVAACRRFVFRKGMPIEAVDVKDENRKRDENGDPSPIFVDLNTNVWAMAISPSGFESKRSTTGTKSRKRSYDELNGVESAEGTSKETPEETALRYEQMARSVVGEMFNSDWRLDALVEKPLCEVELPATIFRRNSITKEIEKYTGPVPDPTMPNKPVLVRTPWPGAKLVALPPTEPAPQAISYIIRNHKQRGKFDVKKAIAHKVPKGSNWGTLQNGSDVQNEDGETITPEMVLGEPRQGRGVAIIDLPTTEYVEGLVNREEWKSKDIMDGVEAFVWMLGPGVAADERLKAFMAERSHMRHIVSSVDVCPNRVTYDSAMGATLRLSQVDSKRFGTLVYDNTTTPQDGHATAGSQPVQLPKHAVPAERGQVITLEPKFEVHSKDTVPMFNAEEVIKEVSEDVLEKAKQVKETIKNSASEFEKFQRKLPMKDAEIIALGTGSALPSKYRNVSATLVRVPGYGSYLLDAGEGTLGQLRRVFEPAELNEIMKELRVIWISHMHADHILGTVAVIREWYRIAHNSQPATEDALSALAAIEENPDLASQSKRLAVISSEHLLGWLAEYRNVEDFGYSRLWPLAATVNQKSKLAESQLELTPPPYFAPVEKQESVTLPKELYPALLGLQDMQAVFVNHCFGARAVSLTWPDATRTDPTDDTSYPFKVSYSGDCRPCLSFARIGSNSTVLIHEATFEDDMAGNAVAKKHSTTSEALGIGARMRARMTLLTHFSQRYQSIPVIEREDIEPEDEANAAPGAESLATSAPEEDAMDVDGEEASAMEDDSAAVAAEEEASAAVAAGGADAPLEDPLGPPAPAVLAPGLRTEASTALETRIRARSDMRVGVAADYMRVKVGEFAELEKFVPAVQALLQVEKVLELGGSEAGSDGEEKKNKAEKDGVRQKEKRVKKEKERKERAEKEGAGKGKGLREQKAERRQQREKEGKEKEQQQQQKQQ
ncbi:uncharacterized protein K452DRAFT_357775 [Aplosporella prunicola CBS 121167]|uniref:ribonuclease Z n=1 Tax=Aplosporella prunicola CBS 121167 TaxID=1176127 RepID=A0A6A6BJL8_9PEZI|nr:uncharacterized protein K452DRAFT_357775 [Aplosporella prunicola CBS 121167]KAF2143474.1 hypothetical protein K452DRAFT_357775 [Aplosporella prunicola CBS 121167]